MDGNGDGPVVGTGVMGCCTGYFTGAFTGYLGRLLLLLLLLLLFGRFEGSVCE